MRRSMYHCPFGTDLKFHLSRTGPMLWLLSVHAFIEVPPPGTASFWAFAGGFLEIIAAFASDETPGSRAMLVIGGVLPVILGVVLFTRPGLGIAALALLFSLFARGHAHHLADAAADRLARLAEARRLSMTRLDVNVARCEALFASGLQRSDAPSAAVVAADFTGVESTNTPGTHRVTAVAPRYSRRRRAACSMTSSVSRYSDRICWCRSETGSLLEHSDVPWQWCRIRCLVGSVASRAKGWKVWVCCSSAGRPNARR